MRAALDPGEGLVACVFVHQGSTVGESARTFHGVGSYVAEHGIVEKGVNGVFDLIGAFVALTDRRLVLFRQASLALKPRPKALATTVPLNQVRLWWRDEASRPASRLYHFVFGEDEHWVRRGEQEPDADALIAALGPRAVPLPA